MTASVDREDPGLQTPSLRRRATVMVVALVALMLVVLVVATDLVLRERLDDQLRQRLVDRAGVADALVGEVDPRDLARRLEGQGVSVVLTTAEGEQYAEGALAGAAGGVPDDTDGSPPDGPSEGPATPSDRPAPPDPGPGDLPAPDPPGADPEVQSSGDLLSVSRSLEDGSTLVLVADSRDIADTVSQVRLTLLIAALAVLALAALTVPLVVRGALGPLGRFTTVAQSITRGDRGRRLRPVSAHTDLGRTAEAFDEMLDAVVGAESRAITSETRLRDFLSDVAHELRTPIAGIRTSAEHLLRDNPERAQREQSLVLLIRETARAGRLVDDLLLMARIDRGLELTRSSVSLRQVADEVVAVRRHSPVLPTLRVEGPDSVIVDGDRDRLSQVVANLVDNAIRAVGHAGSVTVTVGLAAEGRAVLEVSDDGPGVPPDQRERIFDRLVRLTEHQPTSPAGGSGLGLSLARGIARAHGGDLICADNGPRPGARFVLTLVAQSSHLV